MKSKDILKEQVYQAIELGYARTGLPRKVHPKYLPEVLALVAEGKIELVDSTLDKLTVKLLERAL